MVNKGGVVVAKQEMTRVWVDDKFVPATLVKVLPQEVIRHRTQGEDGYTAFVVGVEKKNLKKKKGQKVAYSMVAEFPADDALLEQYQVGAVFDGAFFDGLESLSVQGVSKGKGYQGVVKRWNHKGGSATHGHKFTRTGGSKGNRKPRRGYKGHPHAGHMGIEKVTLKKIPLLQSFEKDGERILVLRGSVPGARNGKLKVFVE